MKMFLILYTDMAHSSISERIMQSDETQDHIYMKRTQELQSGVKYTKYIKQEIWTVLELLELEYLIS